MSKIQLDEDEDRRLLDPAAVADMLGMSRLHLGNLTRAGLIGHVRVGTGTRRVHVGYLRRHIDEFLADREVAPR